MELFALLLALGITGYFLLQPGSAQPVDQAGAMSSGRLTADEIAQFAIAAGFVGEDAVTATAIALAESGGDPNAVGDQGTSYGLWQIHWTVHPEFDKSRLFDPAYNAQSAFSLFTRRGDFNDWSTFGSDLPGHNNAYARFLDVADQAVNG